MKSHELNVTFFTCRQQANSSQMCKQLNFPVPVKKSKGTLLSCQPLSGLNPLPAVEWLPRRGSGLTLGPPNHLQIVSNFDQNYTWENSVARYKSLLAAYNFLLVSFYSRLFRTLPGPRKTRVIVIMSLTLQELLNL